MARGVQSIQGNNKNKYKKLRLKVTILKVRIGN